MNFLIRWFRQNLENLVWTGIFSKCFIHHRFEDAGMEPGVIKRCHLRIQMRGGRGDCGASANEYCCVHHVTWRGAQINFEDLTPYLTYGWNPGRLRLRQGRGCRDCTAEIHWKSLKFTVVPDCQQQSDECTYTILCAPPTEVQHNIWQLIQKQSGCRCLVAGMPASLKVL